ncbi:hypothetical protein OIV83_000276 [Microbotryomycetes sp. JL201]|nr:hypothetical protein OIV83_000276 [Microbotryomycetes sp. JL201]
MSYVAGGLREWYYEGVDGTKSVLARLAIIVLGYTGRNTQVKVTFDKEIDVSKVVKKDKDSGKLVLKLERRAVYLSNHVSHADWIFMLPFMYLAELENAFYFYAPKTLFSLPLIGRTLQRFGFVSAGDSKGDKSKAGDALWQLGRRSTKHNRNIGFVYFPDAALDAARVGGESKDMNEMISSSSPKQQALLYTLRTLKLNTPDLALYDITIGYSTPPQTDTGSNPYLFGALASLRHPPETIHIHIRKIEFDSIPIGEIKSADKIEAKDRLDAVELDEQVTDDDRRAFKDWLQERWTEKHARLDEFYKNGKQFVVQEGEDVVTQQRSFKVELRSFDDRLSIFGSYAAFYASVRIGRRLIRAAPGWTVALVALAKRKLGA